MCSNLAYQEERRRELIDGKIVMMVPASINHTFTSGNIYSIFWNYLKGKKCTPIADGSTVYLTDKDHFVPDFMVVCDPEKIKSEGIYGAPDLVVEVLSPSTMRNDILNAAEICSFTCVTESAELYYRKRLGGVVNEWRAKPKTQRNRNNTPLQCNRYPHTSNRVSAIVFT